MPEFRPRKDSADLYRNRPNIPRGGDGKLPLLLTGLRTTGDEDVTLTAIAVTRIRQAAKAGGELRGLVQEQMEYCRHWIALGRLAPKDALISMRGIQKSMQDCMDREGSTSDVSISVDMSVTTEAAELLLANGVNVASGDELVVH